MSDDIPRTVKVGDIYRVGSETTGFFWFVEGVTEFTAHIQCVKPGIPPVHRFGAKAEIGIYNAQHIIFTNVVDFDHAAAIIAFTQ